MLECVQEAGGIPLRVTADSPRKDTSSASLGRRPQFASFERRKVRKVRS